MPGDHLVDVGRLGPERLAPGKGEEALRQIGAAQCRVDRFADDFGQLPVLPDAISDKVEIADDDAEEIVEIMRDPAGQAADRLHPLGVAQLLLGVPPLGHVMDRAGPV